MREGSGSTAAVGAVNGLEEEVVGEVGATRTVVTVLATVGVEVETAKAEVLSTSTVDGDDVDIVASGS